MTIIRVGIAHNGLSSRSGTVAASLFFSGNTDSQSEDHGRKVRKTLYRGRVKTRQTFLRNVQKSSLAAKTRATRTFHSTAPNGSQNSDLCVNLCWTQRRGKRPGHRSTSKRALNSVPVCKRREIVRRSHLTTAGRSCRERTSRRSISTGIAMA